MAEYIDREAFLKSEIERCGCVPIIGSCTNDNAVFKDRIMQFPTADVVEVVRCKDCKYCTPYEAANGFIFGKCDIVHRSGFLLDNYCSYGERKE